MADPALKRMTADEFFEWDSGDDRRYQLIDGVPVAMAPASPAHGIIVANVARRVLEALDRKPDCNVQATAAVRSPTRSDLVWEPDLAVTCRPHARVQRETLDPVLIVEVLSPSTERGDHLVKLVDYRLIGTVQEIVLLRQNLVAAEVHRRAGGKWPTDLIVGAASTLRLDTIDLELPLGSFYERVDLK